MADNEAEPGGTAEPTAIVIGGNFGGLAAAIGLRRAGVRATIYEQASRLEDLQRAKGGLHQWPNALRALDVLGALERVTRAGVEFTDCEMRSDQGRPCGRWPLAELHRTYGYPVLQIKRTHLHRALLDTYRELGGDDRCSARCTGFGEANGRVTATFDDGSRVDGDLLIGADGLKSVVRKQLRGESPLRAGGLLVSGISTLESPGIAVGSMCIYYGDGSQFGYAKLSDRETSWFIRTVRLGEDRADLQSARDLFSGWVDPVGRLLDTTDPSTVASAMNFDRKPLSGWGSGRVTLLGDAAHPMLNSLSQGAAQAIEDAAVLQLVLRERGLSDIPGALRAYEQRRYERTANYVSKSRLLGDMGLWRNLVLREVRNRVVLPSAFAWRKASEMAAPTV